MFVSKHMQRDLEKLQHAIVTMASGVEEAIFHATEALQNRDPATALKAIAGDVEIDRLENEVQEECLKILALHQPVAGDLRRVSAVLLISTDLERMGDLAVGIAERAVQLAKMPYVPIPNRIRTMTQRAAGMVRESLNSFMHNDANIARAVIKMDDEVDNDNALIIQELIANMKQSAEWIEPGLSLFTAVRHLERIADHTTNIAEDVIYLVEGAIVRHNPEAL